MMRASAPVDCQEERLVGFWLRIVVVMPIARFRFMGTAVIGATIVLILVMAARASRGAAIDAAVAAVIADAKIE